MKASPKIPIDFSYPCIGSVGSAQLAEQEVEATALLLISDITTAMEFTARLQGKVDQSFVASWNLERRKLYEKFRSDKDIACLHQLNEVELCLGHSEFCI